MTKTKTVILTKTKSFTITTIKTDPDRDHDFNQAELRRTSTKTSMCASRFFFNLDTTDPSRSVPSWQVKKTTMSGHHLALWENARVYQKACLPRWPILTQSYKKGKGGRH